MDAPPKAVFVDNIEFSIATLCLTTNEASLIVIPNVIFSDIRLFIRIKPDSLIILTLPCASVWLDKFVKQKIFTV